MVEPEQMGTVVGRAKNAAKALLPEYEPRYVESGGEGEAGRRYENGIYAALASGPMAGWDDDDIMREAERVTLEVDKSNGTKTFTDALNQIKSNGVAQPPQPKPQEQTVPANVETPTPVEKIDPAVEAMKLLPKVRVEFKGDFGTFRTRYHEAEITDKFLILIYDNRCTLTDVYDPPAVHKVVEVTVGEDSSASFYVLPMGVSVDLQKRDIHIVVLAILPKEHELVREYLGGGFDMEQPGGTDNPFSS